MKAAFLRARSIAVKEIMHLSRDPFTLALAFGLPAVMVVFFGFVIDFNYRDIKLAVRDQDHTRASRELARAFSASGYFELVPVAHGKKPADYLDSGGAAGALIIPRGFAKSAGAGETPQAQLLLDGSDNAKTGVISSYLDGVTRSAAKKLRPAEYQPAAPPEPVIKTRFLFNPELSSRWFVIPGLATVIIGLMSVLLTALTVAREWENGSMELLLSTPVRPVEIVAGKLAPYFALSAGGALFVYLCGRLVFNVPFAGSHVLYCGATALFILAGLAQGITISVLTRQQPLAMQFALVTGLLPSLLLSGFIFPVANMPAAFQYLTMILSQRWFMEINRGIFLKGSSAAELAAPLMALFAITAVLITLAARKFKTDMEP